MSLEKLPPQAYTKETLAHAITWLQTQPEHVKSLVRSQDSLITLYLKWKRNGATALDGLSPAYHERLKNDLKSIRAVMDQFDPHAPTSPMNPSATLASAAAGFSQPLIETSTLPEPPAAPVSASGSIGSGPLHSGPDASLPPLQNLDNESQKLVACVRERLNLSSDSEVVRMLIALGFERIRDQLPRA